MNIDLNIDDEIKIMPYDTIVLSGGSIKGILALGAIQFAYDHFLLTHLKNYIGTSSGSMICYLLIIGYKPIEILTSLCTSDYLEKMKYFDIVSMINGLGAISYNNVNEFLEKMTLDKIGYFLTLGKLLEVTGKNLTCVTYNDTNCCVEYISSLTHPDIPCLTAIRMSSNLPLIFGSFKYMDCYYDDGGIADNFPILYGEQIGSKIIGFMNDIDFTSFDKSDQSNIIETIYKKLFIPISELIKYKINQATIKSTIVKLNYKSILFFKFNLTSKEKLNMFSHGYQVSKNFFES